DHFLVSPVTSAGAKSQKVHFPKSSNWFDFATGQKYQGGTFAEITLMEDHIPVFVRGGAIIPMIDVVQTTHDYNKSKLYIKYYFDEDANHTSGKLYEDVGETPEAYEKGMSIL